ncbi:MAG: RagB/SusD family nutrient uptake outer membrane protein [Bacteroidota bacterium]
MRILTLLSLLLLLFTACNSDEYLEEPIRSTPTLAEILADGSSMEGFVNSAYDGVQENSWWQINFFRQIMDMASDDCWAGNTEQPRPDIISIAHYNNIDVGSNYLQDFWNYQYRGITKCNVVIQEIGNVTDIDPELADRLLGEVKFLRAFFYFQLVKNFGGVPIVMTFDELLTPDILNYQRSTVEEVYALIEQDLLDAVDLLPLKSEYSSADLGRATKGAAQGYLAKVYLFQERWREAADMANEVIQSSEYQLEDDFANVWNVENPNGTETIFEIRYRTDQAFAVGGVYGVTTGSREDGGWSWCTPSSYLEKAFLDEGDEIRLRSTIIKHGEPVFGDPDVTEFNAAPTRNKSARINRKFYIPQRFRETPYNQGNLPLNHILMRYADLLLIYAEASYFAGDEMSALNAMKQVRDRVQLETDMSLTGEALRDAIWKERRLELALEQHRVYDLRRQKINGVSRLATVFGPDGDFVRYNMEENTDEFELSNIGEDQAKGITFDINKHTVWPIPTSEIVLSRGMIVQNPNY